MNRLPWFYQLAGVRYLTVDDLINGSTRLSV